LNYRTLIAHCSESLKEGTFVDNTFRGTLWITKVWRHIELRKSKGKLLWKSEWRNVRWQHLQRHIANYKSLKAHWIMKVWRKERSLTTSSETHCELWKSEGTLSYKSLKAHYSESLKEGMFIDNTFGGTLQIMKVWGHVELWKSEGTLLRKSEGRNARWQHLQRHTVNYESLKAHWITKVLRHIALKDWRNEHSLTPPLESHCELRKSEGTLNYKSMKAHCSESLKEGTFVDNTFRDTLNYESLKSHWIIKFWRHIALKVWRKERSLTTPSEAHCQLQKSEGTLSYECLKEETFVDNTFRGTLRITKVWRHIELWKSEGTLLWMSEGRNVRWQHLQRHIVNYENLKAHWITKVWRHIALNVWRKECLLTTPSEGHYKL
jgi:hypothetical protein